MCSRKSWAKPLKSLWIKRRVTAAIPRAATVRGDAHALPFASIMQTPIDVWLGKHHGPELVGIIALQAMWALVLLGLGRLTLRLGAKKLVIQGG